MRQYFRATLDFRWGEMDKDKVPEGERAISQFFKGYCQAFCVN